MNNLQTLFKKIRSMFLEQHHVVSGYQGKASQCGSHFAILFNAENTSFFLKRKVGFGVIHVTQKEYLIPPLLQYKLSHLSYVPF